MKSVFAILAFFFSMSVAQAELNGFANVNCKYKSAGVTKKPIVTLSTVYSGNNYEPVVTLSVAYVNTAGKRVLENATVVDAFYTESYEGYIVGAYTTSGRYLEITMYIAEGDTNGSYSAWISVDGNEQPHMTNLTCQFATAG